ncbi:MAG: CaiB/BaiF CoA-transferase family protein [Pseudomonadota bacterium]
MTQPPLAGLKVIELARILAGPWAGQTLSDLGADVTKIESASGDDTRNWGPPFIARDEDRSAAYFHGCNRGKRSVVIDIKSPDGQEKLRAMAQDADVLIENFKVGGLKKYGLDYDTLSAGNPRLIYCSITGFGQTGPYAHRPGYDYIIQGMSGLMSITGTPEGQPLKTGVAVTDLFTGLYAATAILSAVYARQTTGTGQHIDMSLLDCAVAMNANQAMNYLSTGTPPGRLGNVHPNLAPYQVFDCSDGHMIVAVGNDTQFVRFCALLGCPDLAERDEFRTNPARVENRADLTDRLSQRTRGFTCEQLLSACEASGVPAGPINDMEEVFNDPQVKARGLQIAPGNVPGVRTPIRFSESELSLARPSPVLGEDT